MKHLKHTSLALICGLTLVGSLYACGETPVTSPETTASPSPEASPEASAEPTPEPTPTPNPTVTPFPTGTPAPSSTPLPTPTPVFGGNDSETVSFSFRARVITDDREVLPVSETEFTAKPYNLEALQAQLASQNKVEPKPQAPQQSDAKYQQAEKVCTSSGCTTRSTVDMEAYQNDLDRYQNSILPEWESRAYAGLDDAIAKAAAGRKAVSFNTDANGEASVRLESGTWYFSGRYAVNGVAVVWESVPFEISSDTQSIDLTR